MASVTGVTAAAAAAGLRPPQHGFLGTASLTCWRRAATTEASTDRAISSGVSAPMGVPAGATMAPTRAASAPAASRLSFRTPALRSLATNQVRRAPNCSAAVRAGMSRRPCVATTTQLAGGTAAATAAASSSSSTRRAAGASEATAPWATQCTAKPTRGARSHSARATGESPNTTSGSWGSTGSTNSSSVPPEWQDMPNSSTSPSCFSSLSLAGVMRRVRGWPSASARRAVLMTAGWAQPPPIHPRKVPSAVTTALSPGRAEVGGVTRSTVTSA